MVENNLRARGRPRSFDAEVALDSAAELFWAHGYSATSLDELSATMGMGRPSIYNAFGDKQELFLRVLERFRDTTASAPLQALEREELVGPAVDAFFEEVVAYTTADRGHRGCLLGSVAISSDLPAVQRFLRTNLRTTETRIAKRLATAVDAGQLPADYSASAGARRMVNSMLALGTRARLGTPRRELLSDAAQATNAVLGRGDRPCPAATG
jgi:AcrR family transcriptional regulator